jgi:hypothetical protein
MSAAKDEPRFFLGSEQETENGNDTNEDIQQPCQELKD